MRIASHNVENLFERARALSADDPDAPGDPPAEAIVAQAEINALLRKAAYSVADRARIVEVDAEIIGVVQAEARGSLRDFGRVMLRRVGGEPYAHPGQRRPRYRKANCRIGARSATVGDLTMRSRRRPLRRLSITR